MSEELLGEQAQRLTRDLGRFLRRLNSIDPEDVSARLTMPQLRLCMLLREGALHMSCISKELAISLSAVTQIANRLQRAGLVCRLAQEDDRRVRLLQLTPQGEEMVRQRYRRRLERARTILAAIEPTEREAVVAALDALAEAARQSFAEVRDDLSLADESAPPQGLQS